MALMLTFFVLLYAMSKPDVEKWSEMTSAIDRNFNKYYAPEFNEGAIDAINIDRIDNSRALDLRYLASVVQKSLSKTEQSEKVLIFVQQDSLVVSMPNDLFFEVGQAEVLGEGKKVLFELARVLQGIKNAVEIVGHADPRPVGEKNQEFTSNWDLSLVRAQSVAGVLENVGYTKPLVTRGMSSARFSDLPKDMDIEKRLDLSRRVDIVILKDKGKASSFFGMKL